MTITHLYNTTASLTPNCIWHHFNPIDLTPLKRTHVLVTWIRLSILKISPQQSHKQDSELYLEVAQFVLKTHLESAIAALSKWYG